jgi:hypothetical protein
MVNPTTQKRVQQAVGRGYELLTELTKSKDATEAAKRAEDDIRRSYSEDNEPDNPSLMARDEAIASAEDEQRRNMDSVDNALILAQEEHTRVAKEVNSKYSDDHNAANEAYEQIMRDRKKDKDMRLATAHADVYRMEQETKAVQTTIDQNRQVVLSELGIDLNHLLVK